MKRFFPILLALMLLCSVPALAAEGPDSRSPDPATCAHHFEVSVVREATCGMKGLLAYTCAKCGLTYTAETLPDADAHDYVLTESTATCTEDGENIYTCANCGDTYTEPVAAAGHVPSASSPDCTESVFCTVCGELIFSPIGHDYTYQFDAQFDQTGALLSYGTWRCSRCGAVMAATWGNAEYYYGLTQPEQTDVEASAADLVPDGAEYDDASPTDAVPPPTAEDAGGQAQTPEDDGTEPAGQRKGLWIGVSAVALIIILAEVVLLVRSLRKSRTPLD